MLSLVIIVIKCSRRTGGKKKSNVLVYDVTEAVVVRVPLQTLVILTAGLAADGWLVNKDLGVSSLITLGRWAATIYKTSSGRLRFIDEVGTIGHLSGRRASALRAIPCGSWREECRKCSGCWLEGIQIKLAMEGYSYPDLQVLWLDGDRKRKNTLRVGCGA